MVIMIADLDRIDETIETISMGKKFTIREWGNGNYYCDSMLTDKQKLQDEDGLSMASEDGEVEESCPINHSLDRA